MMPMKIAKWRNSLASRLSATVVSALGLPEAFNFSRLDANDRRKRIFCAAAVS
jgi:antitoxin component of MazEF toxin-antitoxin module